MPNMIAVFILAALGEIAGSFAFWVVLENWLESPLELDKPGVV